MPDWKRSVADSLLTPGVKALTAGYDLGRFGLTAWEREQVVDLNRRYLHNEIEWWDVWKELPEILRESPEEFWVRWAGISSPQRAVIEGVLVGAAQAGEPPRAEE